MLQEPHRIGCKLQYVLEYTPASHGTLWVAIRNQYINHGSKIEDGDQLGEEDGDEKNSSLSMTDYDTNLVLLGARQQDRASLCI